MTARINLASLDAKAEIPVLWPNHEKNWLIGKDWFWKGLGAGGKGDDQGWDGWMASPTRWTWVWVNSGSWWWTGRPGVLQFMGSQRVGHDWATELNWTAAAAAAAAAKSLQSCPTLWDPIDSSPPGSSIPGILQARTSEWVAISFSNSWKWEVESEVAQLCLTHQSLTVGKYPSMNSNQ